MAKIKISKKVKKSNNKNKTEKFFALMCIAMLASMTFSSALLISTPTARAAEPTSVCIRTSSDNSCDADVPISVCEASYDYPSTLSNINNIPACQPACCLFKKDGQTIDTDWVFYKGQCKYLAETYGYAEFDSNQLNMIECDALVEEEAVGYCRTAEKCYSATKSKCLSDGGAFSLNNKCPNCKPHDKTACDNGDVYYFDSCGIKEELSKSCDMNTQLCKSTGAKTADCVANNCQLNISFTNLGYDTAYLKAGQVEYFTPAEPPGKIVNTKDNKKTIIIDNLQTACVRYQGPGETHLTYVCSNGVLEKNALDKNRDVICDFNAATGLAYNRTNDYRKCGECDTEGGFTSGDVSGVLTKLGEAIGANFINPQWWDYWVVIPGHCDHKNDCKDQGKDCTYIEESTNILGQPGFFFGPTDDCVPKFPPTSGELCSECMTTQASSPYNKCVESACLSRGYCEHGVNMLNLGALATICTIETAASNLMTNFFSHVFDDIDRAIEGQKTEITLKEYTLGVLKETFGGIFTSLRNILGIVTVKMKEDKIDNFMTKNEIEDSDDILVETEETEEPWTLTEWQDYADNEGKDLGEVLPEDFKLIDARPFVAAEIAPPVSPVSESEIPAESDYKIQAGELPGKTLRGTVEELGYTWDGSKVKIQINGEWKTYNEWSKIYGSNLGDHLSGAYSIAISNDLKTVTSTPVATTSAKTEIKSPVSAATMPTAPIEGEITYDKSVITFLKDTSGKYEDVEIFMSTQQKPEGEWINFNTWSNTPAGVAFIKRDGSVTLTEKTSFKIRMPVTTNAIAPVTGKVDETTALPDSTTSEPAPSEDYYNNMREYSPENYEKDLAAMTETRDSYGEAMTGYWKAVGNLDGLLVSKFESVGMSMLISWLIEKVVGETIMELLSKANPQYWIKWGLCWVPQTVGLPHDTCMESNWVLPIALCTIQSAVQGGAFTGSCAGRNSYEMPGIAPGFTNCYLCNDNSATPCTAERCYALSSSGKDGCSFDANTQKCSPNDEMVKNCNGKKSTKIKIDSITNAAANTTNTYAITGLNYNASDYDIEIKTNKYAECRYSLSKNATWNTMSGGFEFSDFEHKAHAKVLDTSVPGEREFAYYVQCVDGCNAISYTPMNRIVLKKEAKPDVLGPIVISQYPTPDMVVEGSTTGAQDLTLTLKTDEKATCRFMRYTIAEGITGLTGYLESITAAAEQGIVNGSTEEQITATIAPLANISFTGSNMNLMTSNDMITHKATLSAQNNNKTYAYAVLCQDIKGNNGERPNIIRFRVSEMFGINIINPPAASEPIIETLPKIEAETERAASCRYSIDETLNYAQMISFDETGLKEHTAKVTAEKELGAGTHVLTVKCLDSTGQNIASASKDFKIIEDTVGPVIVRVFKKRGIASAISGDSLFIATNEPSACEYSREEFKFGAGTGTPMTNNNAEELSTEHEAMWITDIYYIICKDKANKESYTIKIKPYEIA